MAISDVIPSSSIFENYPIGFLTLSNISAGTTSPYDRQPCLEDARGFLVRSGRFRRETSSAPSASTFIGFPTSTLPSLAEAVKRRIRHTGHLRGLSAPITIEIMRDCPSSISSSARFDRGAAAAAHGDHQVRGMRDGAEPRVAERQGRHGERAVQSPPASRLRALRLLPPDQETMKYHDPSGYCRSGTGCRTRSCRFFPVGMHP